MRHLWTRLSDWLDNRWGGPDHYDHDSYSRLLRLSHSSIIIHYERHTLSRGLAPFYPLEWQRGFGHSPECTSYAQVWQKGGQYTFSNCGSRNTVVQAAEHSDLGGLPSQVPPGVLRDWQDQYYVCCGNCSLHVSEVRLYYFPESSTSDCANQTSNSTATVPTSPIGKRIRSLAPSGRIATLSGHTLYV